MTEIKEFSAMVFLPAWNTQAYIDESGIIYIQLIQGQYHTKQEFQKHITENGYPSYLSGFFVNKKDRQDFMDTRMELYDDIQKYYEEHGQK